MPCSRWIGGNRIVSLLVPHSEVNCFTGIPRSVLCILAKCMSNIIRCVFGGGGTFLHVSHQIFILAFLASCSGFELLASSLHCCPYGANHYDWPQSNLYETQRIFNFFISDTVYLFMLINGRLIFSAFYFTYSRHEIWCWMLCKAVTFKLRVVWGTKFHQRICVKVVTPLPLSWWQRMTTTVKLHESTLWPLKAKDPSPVFFCTAFIISFCLSNQQNYSYSCTNGSNITTLRFV